MPADPFNYWEGDTFGVTLTRSRSGGITLRDRNGSKLAHAGGYGYDKSGSALAQWVNDTFQPELLPLHGRAWYPYTVGGSKRNPTFKQRKRGAFSPASAWPVRNGEPHRCGSHACDMGCIYGTSAYYRTRERKAYRFSIDGACGFSEVEALLARIGIKVQRVADTKTSTAYALTGFDKLRAKRERNAERAAVPA